MTVFDYITRMSKVNWLILYPYKSNNLELLILVSFDLLIKDVSDILVGFSASDMRYLIYLF